MERNRESRENLTSADLRYGRAREIAIARELVMPQTLDRQRRQNPVVKAKNEEPIRPAELRESVY